jgi:hypothetical protein
VRDDLSHLQPELAGRLRVALARLHQVFEGADLDDREMSAVAEVGLLVVQLVHLQAHEMARLKHERRQAKVTTWVAALALGLALVSLWR